MGFIGFRVQGLGFERIVQGCVVLPGTISKDANWLHRAVFCVWGKVNKAFRFQTRTFVERAGIQAS